MNAAEYSCPGCGCTDSRACEGGCHWVCNLGKPRVCSTCDGAQGALQTLVRAQPGSGTPSPLQHALKTLDGDLRPETTELVHEISIPLAIGDLVELERIVAGYRTSARIDHRSLVRPKRLEVALRQAKLLIELAREEAS